MHAIKVQKLQVIVGSPAQPDFEEMVCGKLVDNCPILVTEVCDACTIFGLDLVGLGGEL